MPAALTYPGVYIVEVPSGVHAITGVSTSITAFIGQATMGPTDTAVLCQTPSDFNRTFGLPIPGGNLGQAVMQFFSNGGNQCYVIRVVGSGSSAAAATLTCALGNILTITSKAKGLWANGLVVTVDYNTTSPDSTFNMQVTYPGAQPPVQESFANLSMDPNSPLYAVTYVTQASSYVSVALAGGAPATAVNGYSQARYPIKPAAPGNEAQVIALLGALFPSASGSINISVDGGPIQLVTFDQATVVGEADLAHLATYMELQINTALGATSGTSVTVSFDPTTDTDFYFARITSNSASPKSGSVQVTRAPTNDLASTLMWGVNQGGIEVSRYSDLRPTPNGTWSMASEIDTVTTPLTEASTANATSITVDGAVIPLAIPAGKAGGAFYQGALSTDDMDGIREKLAIIANTVNTYAAKTIGFNWVANVSGYRLWFTETNPATPHDADATFALNMNGDANAANLVASFSKGVAQYPLIGGNDSVPDVAAYLGNQLLRTGLWALDAAPIFNLMVLPGDGITSEAEWQQLRSAAAVYCASRRAFLLLDAPIDPPSSWTTNNLPSVTPAQVQQFRSDIGSQNIQSYCAVCYPRVQVMDGSVMRYMGASAMIAGLCATTDAARGVWVAPAGTTAGLTGVIGLEVTLTDAQNGTLNPLGVNCIRSFPAGYVNWGARTVAGFDNSGDDDYKYVPVRRFALFLEESLYEGTQWVVFQPNAEPLWSQIRMNIGSFMLNLFRQGAFAGSTPTDAYFVKCDAETTTPSDQIAGIVNIVVGFAPLRPAEFVVISIQQIVNLN